MSLGLLVEAYVRYAGCVGFLFFFLIRSFGRLSCFFLATSFCVWALRFGLCFFPAHSSLPVKQTEMVCLLLKEFGNTVAGLSTSICKWRYGSFWLYLAVDADSCITTNILT